MLILRYVLVILFALLTRIASAEQITVLNPSIVCKALLESSFSDFIKNKDENNYLIEFDKKSLNVVEKSVEFKFHYDFISELYGLDSYILLSKERNREKGHLTIPDYKLPCKADWVFGNQLSKTTVATKQKPVSEDTSTKIKATELAENTAFIESGINSSEEVGMYQLTNSYEFLDEVTANVTFSVDSDYFIPFIVVDGVKNSLDNGEFTSEFYIPRIGTKIEVAIPDPDGEFQYEYVEIKRISANSEMLNSFKRLMPKPRALFERPDDLAIIIGLSNYENTPNTAKYADRDASAFYDYARLSLGIPQENILELSNENAEKIDIQKAVKIWIKQKAKSDQSNIFLFFAGHGLSSDDGENIYILPYDGEPELLEISALSHKELFSDINEVKPKNVFAFFDTCYSGTTRSDETLIASRPVQIRAKPQSIPDNFAVFAAAGSTQVARPIEKMQHGLFSYFLMLGLEGAADGNNDGKITSGELNSFIATNVNQWSSGAQTPELLGSSDFIVAEIRN